MLPPQSIVMIGTSFETMGGIAAAVALLRDSRLFRDWPVRYLATHCDGSKAKKLVVAVRAWAVFVSMLATSRVLLVHAHVASDASFWRKSLFLLVAFTARVPVIFHMHGAEFIAYWRRGGPLRRAAIRQVLTRSETVVALSESWRTDLLAIAPRAHIVVIPNPVEIQAVASHFRRPGRLLFLGRIGERKGSYDLLEALALLKPRHPNIELMCGGDGELDRFSAQARALDVAGQVRLLGWVRGAAKRRHFARASIFVLPSHFEGLPMALLEAMSSGIAVISTPVGGIPELVRDEVDGLLVPPGKPRALAEAIERLLLDSRLRDSLGASARERVETRYSLSVVVERIETVYLSLGMQRPIKSTSASPA
jgi:glycosyltransferase involved in cell wall biosynthesis